MTPVIPPKSNRRFPAGFDNETCKWRHLIENCFGKRKENRGTAMRSCKTDQSFKAFIPIAATIILTGHFTPWHHWPFFGERHEFFPVPTDVAD